MKAGLVSLLGAESTVSSLVGGRIFSGSVPESAALPNILIMQESVDELTTLEHQTGGLRIVDFSVECRAGRSVSSDAIANASRVFLGSYTGSAGGQTIDAVNLQGTSSDFIPPEDSSDVGLYTDTVTFSLAYTPA